MCDENPKSSDWRLADPARGPADPKRPMKTWSNAWLRVQFIDALNNVDRRGVELVEALAEGEGVYGSWFWTPPPLDGSATSDPTLQADGLAARARQIIANTDYAFDEDRSRTRNPSADERAATRRRFAIYDLAPGVVAASPELLARVDAFNAARARLDPLLTEMNRPDRKVTKADDCSGRQVGKGFLRHVLIGIERADLNLHRVRRQLQRLDDAPLRLGFTWAIQRRIRRIDLATLQTRLDRLRDATDDLSGRVHADLSIVAALRARYPHPDDQPALAHITAPHRNPKANLVFRAAAGTAYRRQLIRAILPIFYPGTPDAGLVPFSALKPLPDDSDIEGLNDDPVFGADGRLKRNDVEYEHGVQLLQTLPIYGHKALYQEFCVAKRRPRAMLESGVSAGPDRG